jgi:hypothetical protein
MPPEVKGYTSLIDNIAQDFEWKDEPLTSRLISGILVLRGWLTVLEFSATSCAEITKFERVLLVTLDIESSFIFNADNKPPGSCSAWLNFEQEHTEPGDHSIFCMLISEADINFTFLILKQVRDRIEEGTPSFRRIGRKEICFYSKEIEKQLKRTWNSEQKLTALKAVLDISIRDSKTRLPLF